MRKAVLSISVHIIFFFWMVGIQTYSDVMQLHKNWLTPTFLLFSFANGSFVSLNIFVLKFMYWDANNALSFPLFRFNFSKKIQGLKRHICYSLPSTTAASREHNCFIYSPFLLISVFPWEATLLFCEPQHLPPERTPRTPLTPRETL